MTGCPHCRCQMLADMDMCDGCYEVRSRLPSFLMTSESNHQFVREALEKADRKYVERMEPERL